MNPFIPSKDFSLETARFNLRRPSAEDLPSIFEATRVPGFNDGMVWDPPEAIEDMYEYLEQSLNSWDSGESFTFSIDLKSAGDFVGRIGIRQMEGDPEDTWNVGYFTIPKSQSKGIMSEALAAVLEFGFTKLGAEQIEAAHAMWNVASRRVLEKNGMTFTRHEPQGFQKNGEWVAEDFLSISKEEWGTRSRL